MRVCACLRECVIDLRVHFALLQCNFFTFAQDAAEFAATLAVVCARVCVCVCLSVCLCVCACVHVHSRFFGSSPGAVVCLFTPDGVCCIACHV